MYGFKRGICFKFWGIILVVISLVSIILSFININNLTNDDNFLDLASFPYRGDYGELTPYCLEEGFLSFAWSCGLLSVTALITGLMVRGVEERLSNFNLVFLLFSGVTAFITSIIILVCSSMVLRCHVTLTGELPAANLLISIFAIFQCLISFFFFLKVIRKRWEMSSDLKYGIEPLPDPFELAINPENVVIVRGSYPELDDVGTINHKDDFFKAMSKPGSHFKPSFASSNAPVNSPKYQLPTYPSNNMYSNNSEMTSMYSDANRAKVERRAGGWVSSADKGGGADAVSREMTPGGGGMIAKYPVLKYAGCPEDSYDPYTKPILKVGTSY